MPLCSEMITDEDIYDYIVVNLPGINKMLQSNPDVCIQKVDDQWLVAHSRLPDDRDFNISDLGYYTIPKLYGLMDTSSIDAVNATNITSQPFLNSKGQGVIVGIIDTGIDYLSENFCDTAGNTRIMAIWDQTLEYRQNLYVNYGRIYEQAEINTALEAYRNGLNPYDYVGTTDITGHGTFMAGVIASRKIDDYIGVAPEASIVCVKLKNAKKYLRDYFYIRDDAVCFEETDIMLAARFLKDYAGLKKMPLVIYMGLGSGLGSRTGGSPLSNVLDSLTMHVNTCVVVPAGNEAVKRTHFSGYASVVPEYKEMEINVERRGKGFVLEIWAELGIIGIILLAVIILCAFGKLLEINANNGKKFDLVFCVFTSLLLFLLFGLTDYVFNSPKQIILFMILMGLTQAISQCYEKTLIKSPDDFIKVTERDLKSVTHLK